MNTTAPSVTVKAVSRWYGNVVAVNDISFEIRPGITGLLGPNGAGKTTLLHMLVGLLPPSEGEISVLGEPVRDNPSLYARIGFVSERDAAYEFLTARDFLAWTASLQKLPDPAAAAERALEVVGLTDAADRRMGGFSKGMRQRALVAAGLIHDPELLILDEPFSGTDPRQRLQLMALLKELAAGGRTIIFSSHILEEVAQLASSVLVLISGRLAASGDYRQIRRLMTNRPHIVRVTSDDNRRLAAALVVEDAVTGLELDNGSLVVRTTDLTAYGLLLPRVAQSRGPSPLRGCANRPLPGERVQLPGRRTMNVQVMLLTLYQQMGPARLLLMGLLAAAPIAPALIFVLADPDEVAAEFATGMLDSMVLTLVLPLIALLLGAGVIGNEIQEGTFSLLLLKPIARPDDRPQQAGRGGSAGDAHRGCCRCHQWTADPCRLRRGTGHLGLRRRGGGRLVDLLRALPFS